MRYCKKLKFAILFLLFLAAVVLADFGVARAIELEIPLPPLPGLPRLSTTEIPALSDYIKYIFGFVMLAAGLIAFGSLVYAGFRYLTSAGNPSQMSDANDRIFSSIIGIVVIFGSYLLLTTLNPQLVVISFNPESAGLSAEQAPGVYLCKDNRGAVCDGPYLNAINVVRRPFDRQGRFVKFVTSTDTTYGAVLHEKTYREGKCKVFSPTKEQLLTGWPLAIAANAGEFDNVGSITVFRQTDDIVGEGVSLYQEKDYNKDCRPQDNCKRWPSGAGGYQIEKNPSLNQTGKSIKIDGNYLAALFEDSNYGGECELFTSSDPDLLNDPIKRCDRIAGFWGKACFSSIIVLPIW